jgi:hypothetical protein
MCRATRFLTLAFLIVFWSIFGGAFGCFVATFVEHEFPQNAWMKLLTEFRPLIRITWGMAAAVIVLAIGCKRTHSETLLLLSTRAKSALGVAVVVIYLTYIGTVLTNRSVDIRRNNGVFEALVDAKWQFLSDDAFRQIAREKLRRQIGFLLIGLAISAGPFVPMHAARPTGVPGMSAPR